jgi:undecaprenyl phosphate N,N'-diacetylbacillosamine 1-phosphate transferase
MSIIGPRPLAIEYLPYYNEVERLRSIVRPGLSGLAQINGRNATIWEQRFLYDIKYIKNISFFLDVSIILKTVVTVIKRTDIGERGADALIDFHRYRRNLMSGDE